MFPVGRSQRRSASLQVCSLKGTSTAFKRKSAFESSEIRQRTTFFAREGVRGRKRAGGRPFAGGLQGIGKWRQTRVCIQVSSRLHPRRGTRGLPRPPSPTVRCGTLLFPDGPEDGRMFRFVLVDFFGNTEGAFDRIADPTTHR